MVLISDLEMNHEKIDEKWFYIRILCIFVVKLLKIKYY